MLALAFTMNYSGATATLGLAFAATGALFPFFSALLGWLGVFLTGSDTSANALFGNLQMVTAHEARHEPDADGRVEFLRRRDGQDDQPHEHRRGRRRNSDEARGRALLFRFTLKHSVLLAAVIGLITVFYAYVMPRGRRSQE